MRHAWPPASGPDRRSAPTLASRHGGRLVPRDSASVGPPTAARRGLPAAYPQAEIRSRDLTPFRVALDLLLRAHLPYPAMVLDGHWTVLLANAACAPLPEDGHWVERWLNGPRFAVYLRACEGERLTAVAAPLPAATGM